jgi:flavin-dependent dehydrogenase
LSVLKNIVIIGGGLAGLISAIQLARADLSCTVIEKRSYPFHRVCGEYISNETVPFLKSFALYPEKFEPPRISRLLLSSVKGKSEIIPLDLGGFGISRYTFDHFLFGEAKRSGVTFFLNTEVEGVEFSDQKFIIKTQVKDFEADVVIGAYGKRSKMDVHLQRGFLKKRSPYIGVKYHIRAKHPPDLIALHNFEGGYCGMSNVEDGKTNLCYLTHRDNLKKYGSIGEMEEKILYKNPLLRSVFINSEFLLEKPETIGEITFETKSPVEDHILMAGDAAGMIAPLCGNGMAMAIQSGQLVGNWVKQYCYGKKISREALEKGYATEWRKVFARRLWVGRQVQKLFGSAFASDVAVNLAINFRSVANAIIRNTHGKTF